MPGPFPSGSYEAIGRLVEDPERGGMNFVPEPGSWAADPDAQATDAHTEVPEPEEVVEPSPKLAETTEFAHRVHDFSEWTTEDPESAKELHDALAGTSAETHQAEAASQQPEMHAAQTHMGETRVPDNMGAEPSPVQATFGMAAPLFAAAMASMAAKGIHDFFKKDAGDTPNGGTEPQPEAVVAPEQAAPPGTEAPLPAAPEPAAEEPVASELEAPVEAGPEQVTGTEEQAPGQEAEARSQAEVETSTSHENTASKGVEQAAEAAAPTPSLSPSFGSF